MQTNDGTDLYLKSINNFTREMRFGETPLLFAKRTTAEKYQAIILKQSGWISEIMEQEESENKT